MISDNGNPGDDDLLRITGLLDEDFVVGTTEMDSEPTTAERPRLGPLRSKPELPATASASARPERADSEARSASGGFTPGIDLPETASSVAVTQASQRFDATAGDSADDLGGAAPAALNRTTRAADPSRSLQPASPFNFLAAVEAIERFYTSGPSADIVSSLPNNLPDLLVDVTTALSDFQSNRGPLALGRSDGVSAESRIQQVISMFAPGRNVFHLGSLDQTAVSDSIIPAEPESGV